MSYCIYTICTKNFKDAYNFVIDSWLNNTIAEKIYIYTDDIDWVSNNYRIEIIPLFGACNDWLTSVNYKVTASKDVVKKPFEKLVFVDMDCYLTGDLEHVFEQEFDFAVTRLNNPHPDVRVSTGIFFFHNTEKTKKLFDEWEELQKNVWGKEKACSQSQNAFSMLIRQHHEIGDYNIIDLDVDIYNRKTSTKWLIDLRKDIEKTIVLHFYNTSYRDDYCVNEVMNMLKEK